MSIFIKKSLKLTVFYNTQKMNMKSIQLVVLFVATFFSATAQQKITVEEIYTGAFRSKGMDALQSMKNTNQYTVLNSDRTTRSQQIDLYDFATLVYSSKFSFSSPVGRWGDGCPERYSHRKVRRCR